MVVIIIISLFFVVYFDGFFVLSCVVLQLVLLFIFVLTLYLVSGC
jgi:hypothetical protein